MSRKLTSVDKENVIKTSLVKLTDEQKKIVLGTTNIDAQYSKLQRYIRMQKDNQKQENKYLLDLASKYRHILEGLECLDQKRWTDEKKIKAFTEVLEGYCDRGVELVEANNRRRLENLMCQRELCQKKYAEELGRYDKEIKELKMRIGDRDSGNIITNRSEPHPIREEAHLF